MAVRIEPEAERSYQELVAQPGSRLNSDGFRACARPHRVSARSLVVLDGPVGPDAAEISFLTQCQDALSAGTRWLRVVRDDPRRSLHGPAVITALAHAVAAIGDWRAAERIRTVAENLPDVTPAIHAQLRLGRGLEFLARGDDVRARPHILAAASAAAAMPTQQGDAGLIDVLLALAVLGEPASALQEVISGLCDHGDLRATALRRHLDGHERRGGDRRGLQQLAHAAQESYDAGRSLRGDAERLLVATLQLRAGLAEEGAETLQPGVASASRVLGGIRARLLRGASTDDAAADTPEEIPAGATPAWNGLADGALARLDAESEPGFFDSLSRLALQRWRRHTDDLSMLAEHDLRGPAQNSILALELIEQQVATASTAPVSLLAAAVDDLIYAAAALPVLAGPRSHPWYRGSDPPLLQQRLTDLGAPQAQGELRATQSPAREARTTAPLTERLNTELSAPWVPVTVVADRVLLRMRNRVEASGRYLTFVTRDDLGHLLLPHDAVSVLVVLIGNLIRNACAASPAAAQISLRIGVLRCQSVPVGGLHRRVVVIEVRDEGSGFDPALAEEMFHLGERGSTRRHRGRGLGLYIVDLAANRLGGCVWAYSRGPGTGSTFTLHLPAWLGEPGPGSETVG